MWCPHCQADVATEVAADGQSLLCTVCSGEVRKVFAPSLHPETRSARELLERWAASELLDEIDAGPSPDQPDKSDEAAAPPRTTAAPRSDSPIPPAKPPGSGPSRPKFRIDAAHPTEQVVGRAAQPEITTPSQNRKTASTTATGNAGLPEGYRQDAAHAVISGPHFDLQSLPATSGSGQSESLWGQLLAYLGIGVLTIGTVLVLWGYFGHRPNYASSGWLVATGGQMLLFLGVVTLISGGMQQTTHEVTRRVEHIGERIIRIEQSAQALLEGPHYGRASTADRGESAAIQRGHKSTDAS